jgi:hypothetical protein
MLETEEAQEEQVEHLNIGLGIMVLAIVILPEEVAVVLVVMAEMAELQ